MCEHIDNYTAYDCPYNKTYHICYDRHIHPLPIHCQDSALAMSFMIAMQLSPVMSAYFTLPFA